MRLTIPKLRTWHLLGIVAASAAFFSVMQFRWSVEDPGYALIRRLRSLDAAERAKAAGGLRSLRPMDRRAIAPLTEMLFDSDFRVRASAAQALTLRQAIADLDDADPIIRALAAGRIEDLGSRASDAVPALVRCLADREADVRRAAAQALGQLGPRASVAIPTLVSLADSDLDERDISISCPSATTSTGMRLS